MVTVSVLAITGGALTSVVVEEMITEAHGGETSHLGPVFLTAGFALFALISAISADVAISAAYQCPGLHLRPHVRWPSDDSIWTGSSITWAEGAES